jgi:hypothetical protein
MIGVIRPEETLHYDNIFECRSETIRKFNDKSNFFLRLILLVAQALGFTQPLIVMLYKRRREISGEQKEDGA